MHTHWEFQMRKWWHSVTGNNAGSWFSAAAETWPLLAIIIAVASVLVWAEQRQLWRVAQVAVLTGLLLCAVIGWAWLRIARKAPSQSVEASAYARAKHRLLICLGLGYFALVLNATRYDRWQCEVVGKALGYGTLVAGAAFMCGVLLGFLFGFRPTGGSQTSDDREPSGRPQPHTNLEEVADWLTKLILGASLVELARLRDLISQFAVFMATGVEPVPPNLSQCPTGAEQGNPAIALAIMGFFFFGGVLYGYIWTRYEVALASEASDTDCYALDLVDRWLNEPATPDDSSCLEMMNAVRRAPLATKFRIFLQAEQHRKSSTEDANSRSLPVFQALVESAPQELFHRTVGEYALALMGRKKDSSNRDDDWKRAFDLLTRAIKIRDECGEKGWPEYELARAVCRINLDSEFKKQQQSNASEKELVLADLDKAKDVAEAVRNVADKAQVIAQWKKLNSVV